MCERIRWLTRWWWSPLCGSCGLSAKVVSQSRPQGPLDFKYSILHTFITTPPEMLYSPPQWSMHPTRIGSLSGRGLTSSARPGEAFHREKVYVKQRGNPRMCCITQLHHPGFSLNIRHTFMGHKFCHGDTLMGAFGDTFPGPFPAFTDGVRWSPTHSQVCLRPKWRELKQVFGDGADHARGQVW